MQTPFGLQAPGARCATRDAALGGEQASRRLLPAPTML
jgi:hypothetical protein